MRDLVLALHDYILLANSTGEDDDVATYLSSELDGKVVDLTLCLPGKSSSPLRKRRRRRGRIQILLQGWGVRKCAAC